MTSSRIRDTRFNLRWNIFEMSKFFGIPVPILSKALNNPIVVAIFMRVLDNLNEESQGNHEEKYAADG